GADARVVEHREHVARRDRAGEVLGGRVEDVEVGVLARGGDESEPLQVRLEGAELPDALVAVGPDAVADLNIQGRRSRRVLDLGGGTRGGETQAEGGESPAGERSGHGAALGCGGSEPNHSWCRAGATLPTPSGKYAPPPDPPGPPGRRPGRIPAPGRPVV